jgi:hypothetical protein
MLCELPELFLIARWLGRRVVPIGTKTRLVPAYQLGVRVTNKERRPNGLRCPDRCAKFWAVPAVSALIY